MMTSLVDRSDLKALPLQGDPLELQQTLEALVTKTWKSEEPCALWRLLSPCCRRSRRLAAGKPALANRLRLRARER